MRFELHFTDADRAYLDRLPLSPQAKRRLEEFIEFGLARVKDGVRNDPANRPEPSKPVFVSDFFLVDGWGDDRWHRIAFTVDDSQATQGTLIVVFIDHQDGEWNW